MIIIPEGWGLARKGQSEVGRGKERNPPPPPTNPRPVVAGVSTNAMVRVPLLLALSSVSQWMHGFHQNRKQT